MKTRINPKVLKWAREESGLTTDEIAAHLDIDIQRYSGWEVGESDIPFGKLRDVARHCKRQVAVFFLPSVPPNKEKSVGSGLEF